MNMEVFELGREEETGGMVSLTAGDGLMGEFLGDPYHSVESPFGTIEDGFEGP